MKMVPRSVRVFFVDTSVFAQIRRQTVVGALEPLLSFDLRYSALTGLELRHSASTTKEWDVFAATLAEVTREPLTGNDFGRGSTMWLIGETEHFNLKVSSLTLPNTAS